MTRGSPPGGGRCRRPARAHPPGRRPTTRWVAGAEHQRAIWTRRRMTPPPFAPAGGRTGRGRVRARPAGRTPHGRRAGMRWTRRIRWAQVWLKPRRQRGPQTGCAGRTSCCDGYGTHTRVTAVRHAHVCGPSALELQRADGGADAEFLAQKRPQKVYREYSNGKRLRRSAGEDERSVRVTEEKIGA